MLAIENRRKQKRVNRPLVRKSPVRHRWMRNLIVRRRRRRGR
jgi:hypothetical protein